MTIHKYFIGTRVDKARYGPQSQDMTLSDLMGVFRLATNTSLHVFPDLAPLVQHINEQIKAGFDAHRKLQRDVDYNILFNAWTRAASYDAEDFRNADWKDVIAKAEHFLVALQLEDAFPHKKPETDWDCESAKPIAHVGRLYTEGLLFIITARAAREPKTLFRDVTLRRHCQWLQQWVKSYLSEVDRSRLLLAASLSQREHYPALQVLCPDVIPASPDTFLADYVRAQKKHEIQQSDYCDSFSNLLDTKAQATHRNLFALEYADHHWAMIDTLRDLLYRVERIASFLTDLEENGDSVAFDQMGDTTETVQALLRGDRSQLLELPEPPVLES